MTFRVTPGQQLARISARHEGRDLETFDPHRFRYNQSAYDIVIKEAKQRFEEAFRDYGLEQAKKIKEWDALHRAAAEKLAEQQLFMAWWKAKVQQAGGDRQSEKALAGTTADALSRTEAERLTGMKHQRVSELGKRLEDETEYFRHLVGAIYFAAFLEVPLPRGATGTGENEWYTPEAYLTLARMVLDKIDLDPASSVKAQQIIQADKFYDAASDGLKRNWHGRVWLNPPFAQPAIEHFVSKMVSEYRARRVTAAIMLTHNYTDTAWFHEAAGAATAICFTRGRIKFYKPDGGVAAPTQGQAFFYFGRSVAKFARIFGPVGFVEVPFKRRAK